jgi:hypothetical protein
MFACCTATPDRADSDSDSDTDTAADTYAAPTTIQDTRTCAELLAFVQSQSDTVTLHSFRELSPDVMRAEHADALLAARRYWAEERRLIGTVHPWQYMHSPTEDAENQHHMKVMAVDEGGYGLELDLTETPPVSGRVG